MDYTDEIKKKCEELENLVDTLFGLENKLASWFLLRTQESRMKKLLAKVKEKDKKLQALEHRAFPKRRVYGGCDKCKAMNCDCSIDYLLPDNHQGNQRKKA
jgi:hypothetical protein